MIISLLKVAIITLTMGVGANKPTPINYVEPQLEKNKASDNEHQFQQILSYNGSTNINTVDYNESSPAFAPTGNNGPYHYKNSIIKTFNYTNAPYIIQGATQENRIVNGYGVRQGESNRPVITSYDLSTLNFYNAYMLTATAIYIETDQPTISAEITISHTPYFKYYNYEDHTITKTINIESYAFIGYDDGHRHVYDLITSQQQSLSEAFNYCYNTPASFNLQYHAQTETLEFYSQYYQTKHPNVTRTYNAGLFTTRPCYFIEFTAFRILDEEPFEFKDETLALTFGSDNPPEQMTSQDLQNLVYQPNVDNPTRINTTYTYASVNQEIVDIPGLMWNVLSMPFAFISQAFNLTLFPGTPYSINFSNLFLTIFGGLVFIFIFKLILKRWKNQF